jgi:DNA-binding NarL/FixJ family response regulator
MKKRRLLIADGHWLMRIGLAAALQGLERIEIATSVDDAREAVRQVLGSQHDLAILDLQLPREGGLWALRQIKAQLPHQRVMLMGDKGAEAPVREALRSGCNGYMRRNGRPEDLHAAVSMVLQGETYLDADYSRQLVLADHVNAAPAPSAGPLTCLTSRELTVFRLIGAGYTNRAAAERIKLSHKTVEKHRAAVMQKLRLRSAVDLRLMARELGVAAGAPAMADLEQA